MTHWNYRMFCRDIPDGVGGTEQEWTIREAFYDERDTRPHSPRRWIGRRLDRFHMCKCACG